MTPLVIELVVIGAVVVVSLISLFGALLVFSKIPVSLYLPYLVALAAGTLLGAAIFTLIPESLELAPQTTWIFVIAGIASFFLVEYAFHWHHHAERTGPHPVTYLNLLGDGIHNFVDGIAIAVTFTISFPLGIFTTIAVIAHEIPQEFSDFAILLYGGFTRKRAIQWNLISALTAVVGAVLVLILSPFVTDLPRFLVPFAAGGFLYIGGVDLIPEIQKNPTRSRASPVLPMMFLAGLGLMWLLSVTLAEPV